MKDDVSALCWSCFCQLRQLRLVRSSLTSDTAKTLVHAFISSSHLDYCNSLLHAVSDGLLKKLQAVQNAAARVVLGPHHAGASSSSLASSPPENQIQAGYECLHGLVPTYLADDCLAVSAIAGKRYLRSARTGLLCEDNDHTRDEEFRGRTPSHLEQFTSCCVNRNSLPSDV